MVEVAGGGQFSEAPMLVAGAWAGGVVSLGAGIMFGTPVGFAVGVGFAIATGIGYMAAKR